jgi:hypothetical protein
MHTFREALLIRNALILATSIIVLGCAARADEFPARKPGLWEITTTLKGSPPDVARLCIDAATEAELLKNAKSTMATICSRHDIRVNGNIATDDSVCRPMSSEQTSHAVTTFNGDAAYTTVTTSHYNPPFMGKVDTSTTQDGKWMGPCGPDMQPGDMITRGRKLHIGGKP